MREVQQRKEYEKKMEHERMLEAKPAKQSQVYNVYMCVCHSHCCYEC